MRRAVLHGVKDRMGERVGDTARRPASRYLGASGGHCGASFWEGESDPPTRPGQLGEGAAEPMAAASILFFDLNHCNAMQQNPVVLFEEHDLVVLDHTSATTAHVHFYLKEAFQ